MNCKFAGFDDQQCGQRFLDSSAPRLIRHVGSPAKRRAGASLPCLPVRIKSCLGSLRAEPASAPKALWLLYLPARRAIKARGIIGALACPRAHLGPFRFVLAPLWSRTSYELYRSASRWNDGTRTWPSPFSHRDRRRGPRAVSAVTPPGVPCGAAAPSLDTEKQLETSVQPRRSRTYQTSRSGS